MEAKDAARRLENKIFSMQAKLSRFFRQLLYKLSTNIQSVYFVGKICHWANKFQIKVESPHYHPRVISRKNSKWKLAPMH